MTPTVAAKRVKEFNPQTFLSTIDGGRKIAVLPKKQMIFAQGDPSDAVFYIREGKVRLTVVSKTGKEATIGILNEGDYFWRKLPLPDNLYGYAAQLQLWIVRSCELRRRR